MIPPAGRLAGGLPGARRSTPNAETVLRSAGAALVRSAIP